jgi:hypothetical protein
MLRLVQVIDQAIGYVPPTAYHSHSHPTTTNEDNEDNDDDTMTDAHAHHHAQQPIPTPLTSMYYTSTVQEKWVDYPEEYEKSEREGWKLEGELAIKRANEESLQKSKEETTTTMEDEMND